MNTRIVHLATAHRSGDPRIFQKECKTLASAGYSVVFIVPGKADSVADGVHVRVVPVPSTGIERMTKTVRQVYRKALEEGPDAVIHLHDADLLGVGFRLKRAGRRVIYDSHEDTPKQMLYQHWIPRLLRKPVSSFFSKMERRAGRLFDGIIAAEKPNARRFPPEKTVTIHNYPIVDEFMGVGATPYDERAVQVAYVGALTKVRGLEETMAAMEHLPAHLDAKLALGGSFHPASLQDELSTKLDAPSTKYMGYLSRPDVVRLLGSSRIGIAILHPTEKYLDAYPTKMFEYMAAGLPVVVSDFPSWRDIVEEAECGFVVDPFDIGQIAERIEWLLDHPEQAEEMGQRGLEAVREKYNWTPEGERLLKFYERLLAGQLPGEPL